MIRVLFVCLGNICRSPMAEFIMKSIISLNAVCQTDFILHPQPPARKKSGTEWGIRFILRRNGSWRSMGFPAREKSSADHQGGLWEI